LKLDKILVISFSPLGRDPRVLRQLRSLVRAGYEVTAAGYTSPGIESVKWWKVEVVERTLLSKAIAVLKLKSHCYLSYYNSMAPVKSLKQQWRDAGSPQFDLVLANDVESLPVALKIADSSPVFLDAHEYAPAEWGGFFWRFFFSGFKEWLCRVYLSKAAVMSTVCQGIADEYQSHFGVQPMVMLNAPYIYDAQPHPLSNSRIRLVHHGIAARERALEEMVRAMDELDDRYELYLYLVSVREPDPYIEELKAMACDRVHFMSPVATEEIVPMLNRYDIGLAVIPPNNLNYQMCLPNKFFEFVQARLAIVTGPSQEMARLVRQYDLGRVSDDFSAQSIAKTVQSMSCHDLWHCKQQSDAAAKELCFDAQEPQFLESVQQLVQR